MISVSEAKEIIDKSIGPLAPKTFGLLQAATKVLAEDVWATMDIPAFAQSSMDGYAFCFADKDLPLTIVGEMAAGSAQTITVGDGEAARIFTGAPLPDGADTVVMQEKAQVENGRLTVKDAAIKQGSNVRARGAEVANGALAIAKGTLLTPAAIGFLAGIGVVNVVVTPLPSVTIIVTGNELQSPGKPLSPGQVYESNSFLLRAALQQAGINNANVLRADDDLETLKALLDEAIAQSDLVLLTGGVSVGDYDFVVEAARGCGVKQHFHKVKQRPGKPLYFGMKGSVPVFGLPGNPSSVLSCFYNYVFPAVGKLMGTSLQLEVRQAPLATGFTTPGGLTQFLKGIYNGNKAIPLGAQESFQLSSFAQANCLIQLEEGREEYSKGDAVDVLLLPV